ncbi:hypothetical protein IWW50_001225 [Coemansia erecta]|nr:hypothetical protein IWW50_001225 [Coemansia erecta]
MCGIQVLITHGEDGGANVDSYDEIWTSPDAHRQLSVQLPTAHVKLGAHVLHLRGPHTQTQPLVASDSGDILCWNGEVFGGLDIGDQNDGVVLLAEIQRQKELDPQNFILRSFSKVEGPYAFVYLDRVQSKLWFSRDYLGRRSLLTKKVGGIGLLISSVADSAEECALGGKGWTEVPAQKIYCVDLASPSGWLDEEGAFTEYSWRYGCPGSGLERGEAALVLPFGRVNQTANIAENEQPVVPQIHSLSAFPDTNKWQPYVDQLKHELTAAIQARVDSIPSNDSGNNCTRVGLLFSGGVDCITIAALLTKLLPRDEPIELFNVAFENPRQTNNKLQKQLSVNPYDVPDRKTGRQGWHELCTIDPTREWRFVEVDVPYTEVLEHRDHVRQLLVPADTVMDMSIALALWFASRGRGTLVNNNNVRTAYVGESRVLLLGMGADEQLGGYSRHRSAWDSGRFNSLGREIDLDVQRIATRNLGRDDRVVSDNGKEARFPFLAANVVKFLSETPIYYKMDMRYPRGIGEKLLLRLLAWQLGLVQASMLAKRAIQFGARTAKMESGQTKGQDTL